MGAIERFEHEFLALRKRHSPSWSLAFTEAGLVLGAGTLVAPMRRGGGTLDLSGEDRILALLAAAFSAPVNPAVLAKLRRAAELWAQGDKCLAQIHIEHLRLPKLDSEEQAFGLFLADRLIASGHSPRDLCEALGFDLPEGLKKYDPDEPRDDHGRWTTGGASGGSAGGSPARGGASRSHADTPGIAAASGAEAAAGVAASGTEAAADVVAASGAEAAADVAAEGTILGPLSAEALAGLATVAAGFAGAAAAFGLVFIPSPNAGVTSQGAVPGEPGLNYSLDRDEGSLRITQRGPAGDEVLAAAHLGQDGVYRDENGMPIARTVGGSVIIDPDAVRAAIAAKDAKDDEDADRMAGASPRAQAETKREEPKLCPAPVTENIAGRKAFDVLYEQYIRSIVNPQEQPPLPPGLAFSLTNPATGNPVSFDDCRKSDGTMIEVKGHYEAVRQEEFISDRIDKEWVKQATRQVDASGGRDIEWYFHEQAAADEASDLFKDDDNLKRIRIFVMPYPGGVPKHNPRINSPDDYWDYEDQQ